jgi:hypothetical protein
MGQIIDVYSLKMWDLFYCNPAIGNESFDGYWYIAVQVKNNRKPVVYRQDGRKVYKNELPGDVTLMGQMIPQV